MIEPVFAPIADKAHFPLLTSGDELPCGHLVGCMDLVFFAPADLVATYPFIAQEGRQWHQYGDARWPARAAWVEFDTSKIGYPGGGGVLVLTVEIPEDEIVPTDWVAQNAPLMEIFPQERSEQAISQRMDMLSQQADSLEEVPGPEDEEPRYAQSYCIYRKEGHVRFVASYTDLLNADGIPLPRYRMANVHPKDIDFCRFSLHSLFQLNAARQDGMGFIAVPQLEEVVPVNLAKEQKHPRWAAFHPSRALKTRPSLRALPNPKKLVEGIICKDDFERVVETCRLASSLELLAYSIPARHARKERGPTPFQNDSDACLAAYIHRANGGAIYVLPERLVEEFHHTDCDEVRTSDLKLPFHNLYLKFTPPDPLFLAEGAAVDGCYIVHQQDEYFISLTARWEGVDYVRSLPMTCLDPRFNIHLPAKDPEMTVPQAVDAGIKSFLEENASPTDNFSQTITRPDGTTCHVEDVRAKSRKHRIEVFRSQEPVFRACLNIIINAACFISFRPEDITDEWDGEIPEWVIEALKAQEGGRRARDRKRDAHRHIANNDCTRIKVCGKKLFDDLLPHKATGTGISPRAHWRRGHWRRQRYGAALAFVKHLWIRPTIVNRDNGPLVETRVYDVQDEKSGK
ncbi:MAG TPA: hypothetical protein PKI20_03855 [Verrucomicrobiota bacterium]|nr:hypothetical protein [Verrucomicrobiota bacterium]